MAAAGGIRAGDRPAPSLPLAGRPVVDARARPLRDLRISVTDRCNFRCTYCMPRDVFDSKHVFLPHAQLLSFEEMARAAAVFVRPGRAQDPPDRR